MAYQVIKEFMDLKDGNYMYKAGDTYPREGLEPTEERITELTGSENRQKHPLIREVEESEPAAEAEVTKTKKATTTTTKGKKTKES